VAVTIHDVADAAGVSVSTVSRSFTMPQLVRAATRQQVLDAAHRLGYQPNRSARSLATGRTGTIGLIVPDIANPFFPPLIKAAQVRARAGDHPVFLADTDEDPEAEAALVRAMAGQVDGIVLCSARMPSDQLAQALKLTPLVLVNRRVGATPAVVIDQADGMRQAVEHLAALGHRRFAYLAGPRTSWSNQQRRRAAQVHGQRAGMDVVVLGPYAPKLEAGAQAADAALAEGVTAVVAYNDLIALGVLLRLTERGVAVPAGVSVIGFDDIAAARIASPPLTTVATPADAAGSAGVELLLALLDERAPGARTRVELGTQLMVRGSTGPAPPRPVPRHRPPG
jgi:LacI family transcriptional regulator